MCPFGSIAVDGACKLVITDIETGAGLMLLFIVNMNTNWSNISDSQSASQLAQTVVEELELRLGLHSCGSCTVTANNISYAGKNIRFHVSFDKQATPSCQLGFVYERVLAVSGKKMEIVVTPENRLVVTATIAKESDYYVIKGKQIFHRSDAFCNSLGYLQIKEPVCPSI